MQSMMNATAAMGTCDSGRSLGCNLPVLHEFWVYSYVQAAYLRLVRVASGSGRNPEFQIYLPAFLANGEVPSAHSVVPPGKDGTLNTIQAPEGHLFTFPHIMCVPKIG